MNRDLIPSLDACLEDLFREERLLTKNYLDKQRSMMAHMAYATYGKPTGRDMRTLQCFCCKELEITLQIVERSSATTPKRMAILSRNAVSGLLKYQKHHIMHQLGLQVLVVLRIQFMQHKMPLQQNL